MTRAANPLRLHAEIRRTRPPWILQGLVIGIVVALVGPAVSLALGWDPVWLGGASSGWRVAHLSSLQTDSGEMAGVLATQAAIILAATLLWRWIAPNLPHHLGPARRLMDAAAVSAFQDRGLPDTGMDVLLYVDMRRRGARIIAGREALQALDPAVLAKATAVLLDSAATDPERAVSDAADILSRRT